MTIPRESELTALIAEMVDDQAPRVFAVVLECAEHDDAQIVAWGMALDESAYMITADGRNQYHLADPENAVNYVRRLPGTEPLLVWANASGSPETAKV